MPIVSYIDYTNSSIKLANCNNTACSSPTLKTIDSVGAVGFSPTEYSTSLALTASDTPVISYYDIVNDYIKIAVCDVTLCTTPTFDTQRRPGTTGFNSAIALSSDDRYVLSYHDGLVGGLRYALGPVIVDNGQPDVFRKWYPENRSTLSFSSASLNWNAAVGATSYEYCIALSTAACTSWTSTGSATTASSSGLSHGATYYWQVRATNTSGTTLADSASYGSFTVSLPPASFTKSSPTVGQRITAATTTLSWAASTYATSYAYCYALSTSACTSWTSTGAATTANISGLTHGATYYWRVRATNTSGTTLANSGTYGSFTVSLPPDTFAKSSPANNATKQSTSVTLAWAASTRATSYEYCIALTTATCTTWKSTSTARTAAVTGLTKNKAYYWQVRAKNTIGTTLSSSTFWKFTTAP